jgi:hypothetical protein
MKFNQECYIEHVLHKHLLTHAINFQKFMAWVYGAVFFTWRPSWVFEKFKLVNMCNLKNFFSEKKLLKNDYTAGGHLEFLKKKSFFHKMLPMQFRDDTNKNFSKSVHKCIFLNIFNEKKILKKRLYSMAAFMKFWRIKDSSIKCCQCRYQQEFSKLVRICIL